MVHLHYLHLPCHCLHPQTGLCTNRNIQTAVISHFSDMSQDRPSPNEPSSFDHTWSHSYKSCKISLETPSKDSLASSVSKISTTFLTWYHVAAYSKGILRHKGIKQTCYRLKSPLRCRLKLWVYGHISHNDRADVNYYHWPMNTPFPPELYDLYGR